MTTERAFIFDMDGVIVDSNPYHKVALKQFAGAHGYDLSEDQLYKNIYGRTNKEWLTNLLGPLPPEQIKAYAEEKEKIYRDLHRKDLVPVPGLVGFLKLLDRHQIPRAVATSAPPSNVEFSIGSTGLRPFFPIILDETFITYSKPNPEIYGKAAEALGLDPSCCVVIEDSLSGVQAGKSAGCKVIGITTTHTREELGETDLVIDNFMNLDPQALLQQIFSREESN